VSFFTRLLSMIPGRTAAVDFQPLSGGRRAKAEALLARTPSPLAPLAIVEGLGDTAFATEYARVAEEVRRRCPEAEVWQSLYLDLLDDEGEIHDEGEGIGAEPVEPDEEMRRLLAGVSAFPQMRRRYAWELGYHLLRFALARVPGREAAVPFAAKAATEEFLLAYDAAGDVDGKVNAIGDLASALMLAGARDEAELLCDYAAAALSAEESIRQELHRLRREGIPFVRESYGS